MMPAIRLRYSSLIWLAGPTIIGAMIIAPFVLLLLTGSAERRFNVGTLVLGVGVAVIAVPFLWSYYRDTGRWLKCMAKGRWVVFHDDSGWIEYLSPKHTRFHRDQVAGAEVSLSGQLREYLQITLNDGTQKLIPTRHLEGGKDSLLRLLGR